MDGSGRKYEKVSNIVQSGLYMCSCRLTNYSFGDGEFKPLGVTAEPEVKHRIIDGGFRSLRKTSNTHIPLGN